MNRILIVGHQLQVMGFHMKKWVVIILVVLLCSGCSLQQVRKWFNDIEWERDDQTIRSVDMIWK